ncbi:MAG: UPF0147 family protein [Nanoarchaeota archaeon]
MMDITEKDVIRTIVELRDDSSVPRNVKAHLDAAEKELRKGDERVIKVNKALNHLEEIADDTNLQSYTRTQLLCIVSMLEKLH